MAKLQSGTRIYGTANVDSVLNVNSTAVVNTSGIYTTGTSNAASYTVGSSFIANTSGIYTTGTVNAASYTVGSSLVANTTGAYHTGTINAASFTIGTLFTANTTLVNAVAISTSTNTVTVGTAAYHVSNGNFGIANSTPADKLAVAGTSYFNGNATFNGVATFYTINGQANIAAGAFVSNAYATLGGYGGAYLAFGQQTSSAQWIQSGYSSAGAPVYYHILLNPLGGNIGIGNNAPTDRLSVNGTSYLGNTVTIAGSIVSTNTISANGSVGTATYVLTSGGAGANVYWAAAASGGGGLAATNQIAWTNTQSFSNSITFNGAILSTNTISANGSVGTATYVLTSGGAGANVYWAAASGGGGGLAATNQIAWTNTQSFSNTITFNGAILSTNTISANSSVGTGGYFLTSGGAGANVYWSAAASTNVTAQYAWTNTQSFSNTITFGGTLVNTPNTVTVATNAGTVSSSYKISTFTNSSAATMTITLATSGAVDGQMSIVRIFDFSAVAQTISWINTENSLVTVPTTSNGSTSLPLTVGFIYNGQTSKWRCLAVA